MKKLIYLFLSCLLILTSCKKIETDLLIDAIKNGHGKKIKICHQAGKGKINVIEINVNALSSHLAHGDFVLDADGDGYTAVGACSGTKDDCNDNDASINPGADEICGDGKDNNCNGIIDENCGPDFKVYNIRNNAGTIIAPWDTDVLLTENTAGDGFLYSTPRAGQKVGYGTDFFDGMKLNSIQTVNWTLISGNSGIVPYLNIWVTDGLGNYAVISSENNYVGTNFSTRTEWKIFEFGTSKTNFNWLFDSGTGARDGAQYLTLNGSRVNLSQLSDRIVIGDPGVYPSTNVGTGAPRGGYGFNLIWGDTQANFVLKSGQIAGLTITASGVVNIAQN
jgi:hypothetical protein